MLSGTGSRVRRDGPDPIHVRRAVMAIGEPGVLRGSQCRKPSPGTDLEIVRGSVGQTEPQDDPRHPRDRERGGERATPPHPENNGW